MDKRCHPLVRFSSFARERKVYTGSLLRRPQLRISACFFMKPKYLANPIGTVDALAATLGVDAHILNQIAKSTSSHYHEFSIDKKSGGQRQITAPNFTLKSIQKRINRYIFSNVKYPSYLFGGISEKDYLKNAAIHSNAVTLIAVDVENFYPSIKSSIVRKIFQYFCRFSPEVADVLTKLTTLNGAVPQGACTSSHIANLVFFDAEPALAHEFQQKGFVYSRLLDDITLSSKQKLGSTKVSAYIDKIASMLNTKNCRIKKSKTKITCTSNPTELMFVTGLWLNRGRPRVDRRDRDDIRSEVYRCLKLAAVSRFGSDYLKMHDRVSGRVAKLAYVGHHEARQYRADLSKVLPLFDKNEEFKTQALARVLQKASNETRGTEGYFERFHQTLHRLNIHSRNNPKFAKRIRKSLIPFSPLISKENLNHGR